MRVRQKELRRTRKRLEERKKLAAKGVAITGTGVVTAPAAQKISRPVSRRASETTPAPRPQSDRGPRRDGPRDDRGPRGGGGDRRDFGNDRGPRRDGPRDEQRPRDTPVADASAPAENTAPAEATTPTEASAPAETSAPATETAEAPATTTEG